MRTIAIINQKGGSGKTTTAINLAAALARRDHRTLLVDADPQSHCALGLAVPESRVERSLADAMLAPRDCPPDPSGLIWQAGRNLDLIPATVRLAAVESPGGPLADRPDRDRRLAAVLEPFRDAYDWCLIDCPPYIGLLTFNALRAADEVLIPVETAFFALEGAMRQVNTIRALGRRFGVLAPYRVLPTLHQPESALARDVLRELERRFEDRLVPVIIRYDERLKEAASAGMSIRQFDAESTGAADYDALAECFETAPLLPPERLPAPTAVASDPASPARGPIPGAPRLRPIEVKAPGTPPPSIPNRAAELAARARQLALRNDALTRRLYADPRVARVLRELDAEHSTAMRPSSPDPSLPA